jgi:hypothetical protein
MADPDHFEHLGSRGFYRPLGVVTFEQAVETVAVGIEHAQKLGLKDLLVNTQALTGFAVPTTFGRYAFAVRWAQAGGGVLRLGVVARRELIDHEKIGMIMAHNRGLDVDVFTNEADAIGWLDSRAAARR